MTGLCHELYTQLYTHSHSVKPCDCCSANPRKGEVFIRHCPSPLLINSYLNHLSTEPRSLTPASRICYPYYKYFQNILKELQGLREQAKPLLAEDIDCVLSLLSSTIQAIEANEDITRSDFFELIMSSTAQQLAMCMKADEAILVPVLHQSFVADIQAHTSRFGCIETKQIPGRRWLLSRLQSHFGEMLMVRCKHDRHGSILFHKNCDLLKPYRLH